ncbi:MAG: zinc metalloprotease, partial [Clostridia bacterium]|nr:zinc metalloprotease [Clostridia bacterium]
RSSDLNHTEGRALGYTLSLPEKEKLSVYKQGLLDEICILLAGRAAEKLMCRDISGGASNDMERASSIARQMVTRLGMSDKLGPIVYASGNNEVFLGRDFGTTQNYSEKVAVQIDEEIYNFVNSGYERALKILEENKEIMIFMANYLVKHEIMDAEQFELCFTDGVTEEMLDAVAERKKKANELENEKRKNELKEKKEKEKKQKAEADAIAESKSDDATDTNGDDSDDDSTNDVFSDDIFND